MTRFSLEVGFATDVGRQRQRNEDSYAIYLPYPGEPNPSGLSGLLLVADGMGGERAGDRASQLAAKRIRDWIASGVCFSWPEFAGERPLEAVLRKATRDVSNEILRLGEEDPSIRGLGSTLVLAVVRDTQVTIVHVGDSRCYRIRAGTIEQLTTDHSWVERQVEAGVLTPEQARTHPQRNVLTRSLGDTAPPEPDLRSDALRGGDVFILCSDGMTGKVTDPEILQQAQVHPSPQVLAEALVRLANEKDGSDNITAVVGLCHDEETKLSSEPEDTEPIITRPDGLVFAQPRLALWKVWVPVTVAVLILGLACGYFSGRFQASRLVERGIEYVGSGQIPQARQEFRKLLGIGHDDEQVRQLLDMLIRPETPPPEAPQGDARPGPETFVDSPSSGEVEASDETTPEPDAARPAPGDEGNNLTPAEESEESVP
ncbi:MAG: hypothetical protein GY856_49465 [bacterium]|nr:hypothetical protein [bacterium]